MHSNFRKLQSLYLLAWFQIKLKYTRSFFGPFWITLSTVILIGGLSFVFVSLFGIPLKETMPWIANGIIIWNYISMLIDESTEVFNKPILANMKITPFELTMITVFKNLIIFAHNSVIIVSIVIIFKLPITLNLLFLFYGFFIIIINSLSATLLF